MRSKKPFSKLSYQKKFERLFWRGFSREEAEKKIRYPYKAIILPGIIKKYWQRAKISTEELQKVWQELGGFELEVDYVDYRIISPFIQVGGHPEPLNIEEGILKGIADRILGDDFEYEIERDWFSCLPTGNVIITQYNGVFV